MSKGDQLFELIHSLELNEKRYFKLQASLQKKESNLSKLFDFYADSSEFNEESLRKKFKGQKFLDQLAVTQNHLYDSILKAMRSYNLKRETEFQLWGMLQDVQFLYEKGHIDQSVSTLKKIYKTAQKHGCFNVLLSTLDWKAKFLSEGFYVDKDETDIDKISDAYYELLGNLQNEREYLELQSKIFNNYYKTGIERKNSDYKTNDQIINQFALKDFNRAQTFKAQCCYLNIHAQYCKINGDWKEAYRYRKQLLDLVESQFGSRFSRDLARMYFVSINNLIPICVKLRRWDEVTDLIERMETLEEKSHKTYFSSEMRSRVLMHSSIAKLAVYARMGEVKKGKELVHYLSDNSEVIEKYHRKYVMLHLYFNLSYFLFAVGEFSPSLRWLNKVVNDTDIKTAEDLHASTRILAMILQFEIGRSELLEYLARSTYRFLNKLEGLYKFEEVMLSFMKKFSKNDLLRQDKEVFIILREDLLEAGYEPSERNALSTLDLISWVDSKIENRPLHEILKAKNTNG